MTRDPERLLGATNADDLERELLASADRVAPPAHAQAEVWRKLTPQIAAAAAATGTLAAGSAAAKAGTSLFPALAPKTLAAKLLWTVAAGGIVATGYVALPQTAAPAKTRDARPPVVVVAPRPAPVAATPAPPPQPAIDPCVAGGALPCSGEADAKAPAPTRVRRGEPAAKRDRLRAESALLAHARAELRGGDAQAAQLTLDRLAQRFPRGVLLQEREVLAIEVLAARGDRSAAQRRARAFVHAHPESPHSEKLARLLDQP